MQVTVRCALRIASNCPGEIPVLDPKHHPESLLSQAEYEKVVHGGHPTATCTHCDAAVSADALKQGSQGF